MDMASYQADAYGELQDLVDALYCSRSVVDRLDLVLQAEVLDLDPDLQEIITLLPPGSYERPRLCDQLNSALAAHGWAGIYGTVE